MQKRSENCFKNLNVLKRQLKHHLYPTSFASQLNEQQKVKLFKSLMEKAMYHLHNSVSFWTHVNPEAGADTTSV